MNRPFSHRFRTRVAALCLGTLLGMSVSSPIIASGLDELRNALAGVAAEICDELLSMPTSIDWIEDEGEQYLDLKLWQLNASFNRELKLAENSLERYKTLERQVLDRELGKLNITTLDELKSRHTKTAAASTRLEAMLQQLKENSARVTKAKDDIAALETFRTSLNTKSNEITKLKDANGNEIKESEDEEPWYSSFFGSSMSDHDKEYRIQRLNDLNKIMDDLKKNKDLADAIDELAFNAGLPSPQVGNIRQPDDFSKENRLALRKMIGIQKQALQLLQERIREPLKDLIELSNEQKEKEAEQKRLEEKALRLNSALLRIGKATENRETAELEVDLANFALGLLEMVRQQTKGCLNERKARLLKRRSQRLEAHWRVDCEHEEHSPDDPKICFEGNFWIQFGGQRRGQDAKWITRCLYAPEMGRKCELEKRVQQDLVFDAEHADGELDARFTYDLKDDHGNKNFGFFKVRGKLVNEDNGYRGSGAVSGRSTVIDKTTKAENTSICKGIWRTGTELRCGQP